MMSKLGPVAKAIAGAVVGLATYVLANGVNASEIKWWAALVLFMGAGYGIVWIVPNKT